MPAPAKIDLEQVVALRAADHRVRAIARASASHPRASPGSSVVPRSPPASSASGSEWPQARAGTRAELSPDTRERGRAGAPSEPVWLLVRTGSWGFGSRQGERVVMRNFPAGLYLDVEEVIAFVRKAKSPQLLLGTGEPPASD